MFFEHSSQCLFESNQPFQPLKLQYECLNLDVLGIPIHYNVTINFEVFKQIVDTLGGIDVEIENTFTDSEYPIEGKEDDPVIANRYETVTFTKGLEKMNGERALKYVRSRHGDGAEGTDFARSKRQQKVILAIKDKLMSPTFVS